MDFEKTFVSVMTISEMHMGILRLAQHDVAQANHLRDWFENQILPEYQSRSIVINVDLVDWHLIGKDFRHIIQQHNVILQAT